MSNLSDRGKVFLSRKSDAEKVSFLNAYSCYQMVGIHILYYSFDMEEQEIIKITELFQEYDQQEGMEQTWEIEMVMKYNITVFNEATKFPLVQKRSLAVIPKRCHDPKVQVRLINQTEVALYCYYLVMFKALENSEDFKKKIDNDYETAFKKFIKDFREVCTLFKKGMTRKWLEDFLVKEHGFDIIKVDVENLPLYIQADKKE